MVVALGGLASELSASPYTRGREAFDRQDYREARKHLEMAAKQGDTDAHGLLGRIAFFYGQYDAARQHLARSSQDTFDKLFLGVLENPFTNTFGDKAVHLEGRSKKGNYFLVTDVGATDKELAKLKKRKATTDGHKHVAALLEYIHYEYSKRFTFKRDEDLVSKVIVFADRGEFEAWSEKIFQRSVSDTAAYYDPNTHILVVAASRSGRASGVTERCQHAIFHEAFHQFIDFYIPDCPYWFNEGVAEYFAPSEVVPRKKRLNVGLIEKPNNETVSNLELIQQAIRQGQYTPLEELLNMPGREFMANGHLHYAESWSVVYFLVHSPAMRKKGSKMLAQYFRMLCEGKSSVEAYETCFGQVDMTRLEAAWKDYVLALKMPAN